MIIQFLKKCEPIGKEGCKRYYEPPQRIVVDREIGEQYISRELAKEVPTLFEEVKIVSDKKNKKPKLK